MHDGVYLACDDNARRAWVFNFLPSQQKVKIKKSLCDLCGSSAAGGEFMFKQYRKASNGIQIQICDSNIFQQRP